MVNCAPASRFGRNYCWPGDRGYYWANSELNWKRWENLQILDTGQEQDETMKRKRGPAPHAKKSRLKPRIEERDPDEQSEEESDIVGEEESFEGFSTHEEKEHGEAAIEADGNNAGTVNRGTGATKKRGKKAAPTQEELMELDFRSSSFQSNLFKLQVDELLSEVRVKYDKMAKVETILHKLKGILMQLPGSEEQLVSPPVAGLMQVTRI